MRVVRVNKFGEETQELRLKPRGGLEELRLSPPCGNGLEFCVCGASSSPPKPLRNGSLTGAIEAAREAAAAVAAEVADRGPPRGRATDDDDDGRSNTDGSGAVDTGAGGRKAKRRRVLNVPGSSNRSDDQEERERLMRARRRAPQAESPSTNDVPLDEIKRQMGKNPMELERRKAVLEEETRTAARCFAGDGGGTSRFTNPSEKAAKKTEAEREGRGAGRVVGGRSSGGSHGGDGGSAVRLWVDDILPVLLLSSVLGRCFLC